MCIAVRSFLLNYSSKGKKKKGSEKDVKDGKKSQAAGKAGDPKAAPPKSQEGKKAHADEHAGKASAMERPESHITDKERGESSAEEGKYVFILSTSTSLTFFSQKEKREEQRGQTTNLE